MKLHTPASGTLALCLAAASILPTFADPSDWPHYLGPDKNSISPDPTPLADSWPADGPTEIWSIEVEPGHGGPAVVDGKVYFMDRVDSEKDVLRVLDFETGKILQEAAVESPGRVNFPGSRGVPTVTDTHVFATGPMGIVAAWKRSDLSLLWTVDVLEEFGAEPLHFGYAVHPQVHEDLVIIAANAEDAAVVALDIDTGKVAWKAGGLFGSLSSPLIREFQGRDQILYISNKTPEKPSGNDTPSVAGLDPKTGKVLWRYQDFPFNLPIPAPVVVDEQTLFLTAGYEAGSQLVKFNGDKKPTSKKTSKWGAHICPPIVHDGHIYFLTHENSTLKNKRVWPELGLNCITIDGETRWNSGAEPMFGRGSMILADGKLIIRDSYFGKLYLVKPDPKGYHQLAEANPFNHRRRDLKRWAPLVISKGRLLIRDEREMKCLDLRSK